MFLFPLTEFLTIMNASSFFHFFSFFFLVKIKSITTLFYLVDIVLKMAYKLN